MIKGKRSTTAVVDYEEEELLELTEGEEPEAPEYEDGEPDTLPEEDVEAPAYPDEPDTDPEAEARRAGEPVAFVEDPQLDEGDPDLDAPLTEEEAEALLAEPPEEAEDEDAELDEEPADIDEPVAAEENTAAERLAAKAALLSEARVRTICESLLFVADKPLNERQIQDATGIEPKRIRDSMEELAGHFREGVSGIVLHEVSGGWQLRTCPTSAEHVRRFLQVRPHRLTRAALETLSIVAYRQPVTRPEIEDIRGVDCGAVVKALLDRGLLQVLGKKEEPGRPLLYGTTRKFLEFFNLKDLASLPTLREFHELNEEHRQIVETEYPEDETAREEAERQAIAELVDPTAAEQLASSRGDDEAALSELDEAMRGTDAVREASSEALDGPRRSAPAEGLDDDEDDDATAEAATGATAVAATDDATSEATDNATDNATDDATGEEARA